MNCLLLQPHSAIDQTTLKKQYEANKQGWDKPFDYLRKRDFENPAPGNYIIDDENVFALIGQNIELRITKLENFCAIHIQMFT